MIYSHTFKNFAVSLFPVECFPVIKTSLLSKSRRSSRVYSAFTGSGRRIFTLIASPIDNKGFSSSEHIIYSPHSLISLTLAIALTSKEPCVSFNSLNQSRLLLHSTYILKDPPLLDTNAILPFIILPNYLPVLD